MCRAGAGGAACKRLGGGARMTIGFPLKNSCFPLLQLGAKICLLENQQRRIVNKDITNWVGLIILIFRSF
jgi:hypothetical protein